MITITHPGHEGRVAKTLPFVRGKNLRAYLRDAGVIALRNRCYVVNARKERLVGAYEPKDGEVITLVGAGRAMS